MNDERKQFFIELEKKTGDAVEALEFVCINADKKTYAALSLASSRTELWGLLVFCARGLYLYVSPSENFMSLMFRQMTHGSKPSEQLIDLGRIEALETELPPKKWYSIFFTDIKHRVDASFVFEKKRYYFSMTTLSSATDVQERIRKKLHGTSAVSTYISSP